MHLSLFVLTELDPQVESPYYLRPRKSQGYLSSSSQPYVSERDRSPDPTELGK